MTDLEPIRRELSAGRGHATLTIKTPDREPVIIELDARRTGLLLETIAVLAAGEQK